jgi:hypothetical protein
MDKKYICSLIEEEKEKRVNRIFVLEKREIDKSLSGNEANELACLKDYYDDFKIFDDILQLIQEDNFSNVDELIYYLRDEINRCDIPEERVGTDNDDVQVYTLKESNFNRIICLDTILFCIEFI